MLIKRAIRTTLLTVAILAVLIAWFHCFPRWQFEIGMPLADVEKRLGHKAYIIPLRSAHTGNDPAYSPSSMISVNRYGMHIYLNEDGRIIKLQYLFGSKQHPHFHE